MTFRPSLLLLTVLVLAVGLYAPAMLSLSSQAEPLFQDADATPEATEDPMLTTGENVERVSGILQLLRPFRYRFEAEADEVITLVARDPSGTLDPSLVLLDPEGERVAENDNHDTRFASLDDLDAVIDSVTLVESGEYIAEVTSGFQSEGPFELFIVRGAAEVFTTEVESAEATAEPARGYRMYGPCTVTVDFISARIRQAPTVNAAQVGSVLPGDSYGVIGKVRDSQGFTWYRLDNFNWVRADAVLAEGACRLVATY